MADSIRLNVKDPIELPDGKRGSRTVPVFVARVGDAIVMLADLGWEFGGGHDDVVSTLAQTAVDRVRNAIR